MEYFLGIDPGKDGCFVILNQGGEIVECIFTPKIGKEYDRQAIKEILLMYPYKKIGLENPGVIFGTSKSSVASLSNCVGLYEGIMFGIGLPYTLVAPKEWQKECWKHVKVQKKPGGKGNDTKATSILAATNLWHDVDFKLTAKGGSSVNYHEGLVDAALVGEYVRRMFKS